MRKNLTNIDVVINEYNDEGEGILSFDQGVVITDNSVQRNGTSYDIDSLDLSEYDGKLTADHVDKLESVIGKVEGVEKKGNAVIIKKIKFAVKENPLARLAYNLFKGGFISNFSTETIGPKPDDDGVYRNSVLVGLSAVVLGNNKNAKYQAVVQNSINEALKDGLDVNALQETFVCKEENGCKCGKKKENDINQENQENMTYVTVKNTRDFDVAVTYKNAAGEEVEAVIVPNGSVDVSEEQAEAVENAIKSAQAPKVEKKVEAKEEKQENLADLIKAALSPLQEKIDTIEQNAFDKAAKEPEFKKESNGVKNYKSEYSSMDWRDIHSKQINAAWDFKKNGRQEAAIELNKINEYNLSNLKKEGVVSNAMTIGDFGNFVISRELLSQIEGARNDYTSLVNATDWRETLSTQFAWLKRSGDIDMTNVEFCDDEANGNLKPISEYTASIQTSDLEELAAVTPVCNAATRFLAADLLGDVAAGYRNDYDRKRAQLVVARLEQAVETNGKSQIYDINPAVGGLTAWVDTWAKVATTTPNGTYVFNSSTYAELLKQAVTNGVSGPLGNIFITGDVPTIFGKPFIVVPDDLMPTLNSAETKAFSVDGGTVTVNHAVFYANLNNFTGRTSGGLMYDLSTEAAYESGGTVYSAYQRNELVLRGSFFRGGAIKDTDQVAGMLSPGVS